MSASTLNAQIGRAFGAAALGSLTGTVISIVMLIVALPPREGESILLALPVAMLFFVVSLIVTVPAALLIGAPLTYPLRHWIGRHPWIAAPLYGALGAAAGEGVAWWGHGDGNSVPLVPDGGYGALYGAATAIAFVWMIRRTRGWGEAEVVA